MGLFQDSLKKWFYTNNSSAASSDARVPLLNANGTPKGSDTMANLASVLDEQAIALSSSDNLNNLSVNTSPYKIFQTSLPSNVPTGFNDHGYLVQRYAGSGFNIWTQHLYTFGGAIYYRRATSGNKDWGTWQRIDNYGTSSLTELASALGVPVKRGEVDTKDYGYGSIEGGAGEFISLIQDGYGGQLRFAHNERKLYARICVNNTYGNWVEVCSL